LRQRCLESKPQLELNPAWRVPLLRHLTKVVAGWVGVRIVKLHMVEGIDKVGGEFQPRFFGDREGTLNVDIYLVHVVTPQPIESRRKDASVKRIQRKIGRHDIVVRLTYGVHEPLRHNLPDAIAIRLWVGSAEVALRPREQLPVEPVVNILLVLGQLDSPRAPEKDQVRKVIGASGLKIVDWSDLPTAEEFAEEAPI